MNVNTCEHVSVPYPTLLAISYDDARGLGLNGDNAPLVLASLPDVVDPVTTAEGVLA